MNLGNLFGARTRRTRRTASAVSLAVVACALVVVAVRNDGDPITEVKLNDGSVWVTNDRDGLIGRLNPQIQELDLGLQSPGVPFDISQRATRLFTDATVGSDRSVVPIDVARAAAGSPTALPSGTEVTYNAGVFALRDAASGRAWVQGQDALTTITAKSKGSTAEHVVGAAVGADGTAYLVDRDGKITAARLQAGVVHKDSAGDLADAPGDQVEVTVVGTTPVVLDRGSGRVLIPGRDPIDLHESDVAQIHLQAPSSKADDVMVATESDLFAIPLDGGDPVGLRNTLRLPGPVSGEPAPPVVLGGCVYAAWADSRPGAANYLRDCPGTEHDDAQALEGEVQAGANLRFRVNRRVVVLNDTATGDAWLVQLPGHKKVSNWDSIDPTKQNKPTQEQVTDKVEEKDNRPPAATDDDLAVRQNKASILPVVAMNDHDPDGDVITIKKVQPVGGGPDVEPKIISGGTQLQVTLHSVDPTLVRLKYTVSDGNGGEDSAEVRLTVLPNDAKDRKPQLMKDRDPRLAVMKGRAASMYLLSDFWDPDGDDLVLTEADGSGGEVEYRPDGTIQFTDNGDGGRSKSVSYKIDDGHGLSLDGKLPVDITDTPTAPTLVPDLKSGVANTRVLVQPLLNDRNPEGGNLLLEKVKVRGDASGTELTYDAKTGTFVFTAEKARTYTIDYRASTPSGQSATSFVRFDVESPPKDNQPPIAVGDKAVLSPGASTQADLLLNDIDDDNDVLVVTHVGESSVPGVKVSVVDKRVAVISSSAELTGRAAVIPYTVSDGHSSAEGTLTVSQRPASRQNRSPVANKDQTTARAGAVATIPVLDNDSDPDGGKIQIRDVQATPDSDGQKLDIWVADGVLRFKAPELPAGKPKVFKAIYGIQDPDGLKSDAEVMVFVIPDSAENNHPPAPAPIIERAVAGQPKTIGVDLSGADPDGDAVTFTRIISAPKRGRIVDTGADWIKYEAYEGRTGTDFFQLEVRDKFGAIGFVTVRVGVVARLGVDQAPVALDDAIVVRPNRRVSVNVLTNDVDPDDDKLIIGDHLEAAPSLHASQRNGFISLDVPDLDDGRAVTSTVGYQLLDEAKASDNALLRVEARADAPFYAPVARDDVVELTEIAGKSPGQTVEVDALKNDLDVDGSPDELTIKECRADTVDGCQIVDGKLRIKLAAKDQVVVYDLADADKESPDTSGVVFVRGTDNIAPTINAAAPRLATPSGVPLPVDITRATITRPGRQPSLVIGAEAEAINGRVEEDPENRNRLIFTPQHGYVGPASISVSVSDTEGGDDKHALTSIVTIPIDVTPSDNVPPTVRGAMVKVAKDADTEIDLAGLVDDLNPKPAPEAMLYSVVQKEGGFTTRLHGSVLTITGTGSEDGAGKVVFSVDDRSGGRTQGTIDVQVVASARPPARVPPIELKAHRGEQVSIDIATYAINPYADQSKALRVHKDYSVEGAAISAISKFKVDGTRISFVPNRTGIVTLVFVVSDASGDPKRDVLGRIKVAVAAPPEKPARPEVSSVEARSVVLSWREPNNNGATITKYQVKGSNGFSTVCAATTCTLDGLNPGDAYTFQVAAENEAGPGPFSDPSVSVKPDRIPDMMLPPRVDANPLTRDKQLRLAWEAPNNPGSEISAYVIKWNGGSKTVPPSTSTVISGLENGVSYQFSIYAVNKAGNGTESGRSDPEVPFGKPMAVEKPAVTPSESTWSPYIKVDWPAPDANGDTITKYVVYCDRCRESKYVVDGTARTFTSDDGIENGTIYTFSVAAINRAGEGERGPSDSAMPYRPSGPVQGLSYLGSPSDKTATIRFSAPQDTGGLDFQYYQVVDERGQVTQLGSDAPNGVSVSFSENGEHSVKVYAVTAKGRTGMVQGDAQNLGGVDTWGAPGEPEVTKSTDNGYYDVGFYAKAGARNGTVNVTGFEVKVGNEWKSWRFWDEFNAVVEYGGAEGCALFRTVSDATDSRKYSSEKQVCGASKSREVAVSTKGGVDATGAFCPVRCPYQTVTISGWGFKKNTPHVGVSVEGAGRQGTCPSDTSVNADGEVRFDTSTAPNKCWFPSEVYVKAYVDGVSNPDPNVQRTATLRRRSW